MIEPMKKVSIVLLNKEKEDALKALRKIGLVHLERVEGSSEKLNAFKEYTNNALVSESILGEIKQKKTKGAEVPSLSDNDVVSLCNEIVSKADRKKSLLEEISADTTELERFAQWGSVEISDFEYLKEKGIQMNMYEIAAEKYSLIDENIQTLLVNNDKKTVRFLILNGGEGRPEGLLPDAFEVPLPRMSTSLLEEEIKKDDAEIAEIEKYYADNAKYVKAIASFRKNLESDIEFENINAGMAHEAEEEGENALAWISGYVPAAKMDDFKKACGANGWAVAYDDPEEDDVEVPTKLKNNKFVSLIYPLTDFLGTVPGYHEYDISGWFLLFFTIFFGMIFGDGGYGLLITVIALVMIIKDKAAGKALNPMFGLIALVGGATVVWGTVTCTWFGLTPDQLPQWLVGLSVPRLSNAYADKVWVPFWKTGEEFGLTNAQNLQIFCFTLALIQLSVAHIKAMIRNHKSLKMIGDLGALLQLIGMYWVVLSMVVSSTIFSFGEVIWGIPVGTVSIGLVAGGFVLSFIFSNYEGSIGASIKESCVNIISVLLGVVNVFSDIVSYIRLWAVGLAGAAISATVNEMAGPLLGHFATFIFFVLLIVFGHGLNMVLNLLSVIVHGVRLNTLEFSSHLGMAWSGLKYSPFMEKDKK